MSGNSFDPFGDLGSSISKGWKMGKWGYQLGRNWRAKRIRAQVEAEYGPEVGEAVEAAVRSGRDPSTILERAKRAKADADTRADMLANPPALHGSADWATREELGPFLKERDGFDTPSSILLGGYFEEGEPARFIHWDEDGHLLTLAPTRSGKAQTVIIPNLLRFRGSCIVLDPKGELFAATSAWRAENVGPVYRWAPFEDDTSPLPRHGFNPLAQIRSEADARSLAEQLFPRDPRAPDFFTEDAVSFLTALILFVLHKVPEDRRNLSQVFKLASLPLPTFMALLKERLAVSGIPTVEAAAINVLGKSADRGIPNLRDTLNAKIARWSSPPLLASLARHDFDFGGLKDRPATIYLDIPFDMMQPYAPVLRVVLKAALDAMLANKAKPIIPVLFVLDEFLQLGPFPEFRNAIRTHAGAGIRLWFFLQDIAGIEEHYPDSWKPFFNCSVRQFFGIDDPFTAKMISSDFLGTRTVAYRATNSGFNVNAGSSGGSGGASDNSGLSLSTNESIHFLPRPLMTPEEVMRELSGWKGDGIRRGIISMRGVVPFKVHLVVHGKSDVCRQRLGMWTGDNGVGN